MLASGCASSGSSDHPVYAVHDPASRINQRSFAFSEGMDNLLLKPVARGYAWILPDVLEQGVRNFFNNIRGVDSAINGFLQANPRRGFTDVGRVLVNTTLGIGGLFDPATGMGLEFQDEDFGQTLAVWGYTESAYLYLPVIGPLTLRDLPAVASRFVVPRFLLGDAYGIGAGAVDVVSLRSDALALTAARDVAALDPYVFTREAYYQRRRYQIFNGNPPTKDVFDEFEDEDGLESAEDNGGALEKSVMDGPSS